jgi:hypothetical protein
LLVSYVSSNPEAIFAHTYSANNPEIIHLRPKLQVPFKALSIATNLMMIPVQLFLILATALSFPVI